MEDTCGTCYWIDVEELNDSTGDLPVGECRVNPPIPCYMGAGDGDIGSLYPVVALSGRPCRHYVRQEKAVQ